ncbi:MAG: hypothetical protein L3K10_08670 [Thermoplasmata archaeon]|nr:hypothetical protein [Thermoplasmata archaeon]
MARTEVVPKSRYVVYFERAREFETQMNRASAEGAWNSVGLLGVHCVISGCDALTVQRSGQRWSGQEHAGVVGMVSSLRLPDADRAVRQISRVLEAKNRVEYESREFTEKEAEEARESVSRVHLWVTSLLRT